MEPHFWLERWEENQIGFHKSEANPMLVTYLGELNLAAGSRLFVPLCGKTLDIGWLLSNGHHVAGAELSELAIQQLFSELGVEPRIEELDAAKRYSAQNIDIFVGDIFDLTSELIGPVDAIYDRAALVALPDQMRARYTDHLTEITANAPQLLVTFEYDQSLKDGPPFSITADMIEQYYTQKYHIRSLVSANLRGGLRGNVPAKRSAWLLRNR